MKPPAPYADSRLAKFLETEILRMRPVKTQAQIAVEAGFVHANMMSMVKAGRSRLPLDRVPALAKALDCDARYLFRLALEQKNAETDRAAIEAIFGTIVSENEVGWLEELRDASDNRDPRMTNRARAALRGIFGK
ncbi:XRE family transcriptional regulator [Psychromarinibacter sp. S121]|uniref:XRE family transcriptional regulator n=1 Tax=Psychromarinibacter sp. S121 TaxID=3415127 RepID=UPI003C7C67AD